MIDFFSPETSDVVEEEQGLLNFKQCVCDRFGGWPHAYVMDAEDNYVSGPYFSKSRALFVLELVTDLEWCPLKALEGLTTQIVQSCLPEVSEGDEIINPFDVMFAELAGQLFESLTSRGPFTLEITSEKSQDWFTPKYSICDKDGVGIADDLDSKRYARYVVQQMVEIGFLESGSENVKALLADIASSELPE